MLCIDLMYQPFNNENKALKGLRSGLDEGNEIRGESRSGMILGGNRGISGNSGLMCRVGGDWGGGERLQYEVGQLGLGVCQFGESEHLRGLCGGSLWGGRSLQASEWHRWGC